MNALTGVMACVAAGIANGSFAVPLKRVKCWKWEHAWLVYSVLPTNAILPLGMALFVAPRILPYIMGPGRAMAGQVAFFGMLWGLGSLLFGLSLPRLGLAVANALVSSTVVLLGSVGPLLVGTATLDRGSSLKLALGLAPLIVGIGLCAAASVTRDRQLRGRAPRSSIDGAALSGVAIAIVAGALSAMLNVGFAYGGRLARDAGYSPLLSTLAVWIPALAGGLVVNVS